MDNTNELKKRLGRLILQMQDEIKAAGYDAKYFSCYMFDDDEQGHTASIWNKPDEENGVGRFDFFYVNLDEEAAELKSESVKGCSSNESGQPFAPLFERVRAQIRQSLENFHEANAAALSVDRNTLLAVVDMLEELEAYKQREAWEADLKKEGEKEC